MGFKVLFFADTHVGYAAKCRVHSSGLNQRVVDGYRTLKETVDVAIENEVDLVVHGGDLFHKSWPTISDIVFARRELTRLADAGIPIIGTTGNHDAAAERGKSPATASVHDPSRGIQFVTDPFIRVDPVDGLAVHVLSHYGLARAERVIPEPVDGLVNIFVGHGAARVPDHPVFQCTDSPGEQPIGLDVLGSDWDVSLLGHYHGRGILPGIGKRGKGHAWYAGSSLRRGFSDPAGERGGLIVDIEGDGSVSVETFNVWQRPQFDLPVVDATGLTGEQVHEIIKANLAGVDTGDAIIRQVVNNVTAAHRASLDLPGLNVIAQDALVWQPVLNRPARVEVSDSQDSDDRGVVLSSSLSTAGSVNLVSAWDGWAPSWVSAADVPEELRDSVLGGGREILKLVGDLDDASDGSLADIGGGK